jgi:hypothetical protein
MMNTRLRIVAGCTVLAAVEAVALGGCTAGSPSGAFAATAGSGGVADVSEAPLLVAPEDDFFRHGFHGGGEGPMRARSGGSSGGAFGASSAGAVGGAMGKGR